MKNQETNCFLEYNHSLSYNNIMSSAEHFSANQSDYVYQQQDLIEFKYNVPALNSATLVADNMATKHSVSEDVMSCCTSPASVLSTGNHTMLSLSPYQNAPENMVQEQTNRVNLDPFYSLDSFFSPSPSSSSTTTSTSYGIKEEVMFDESATNKKRRRMDALANKQQDDDHASNLSNSELKRQIHIQSEQKRRAQIKEGFEELRNELPSCLNKKMSKVALLQRTVQHIQHLKNTQITILSELERLMHENEQLKKFQENVMQNQALYPPSL